MKKYRIREGSIADMFLRAESKLNNSTPLALIAISLIGLALGAIFGIGMNEIYPLW